MLFRSDMQTRTVRIGFGGNPPLLVAVTEKDLPAGLQLSENFRIGAVTPLPVGDGNPQDLSRHVARGETGGGVLHPEKGGLTTKMETLVAGQRPGQKAGFTQNLKSVANADHHLAALRGRFDSLHDRGKPGNRAAAQVIPVGKASWQDQI